MNSLFRHKRMGKRALSPLVATVLLVAFAIGLGSVIMSWSKGLMIQEEPERAGEQRLCMDCSKWIEGIVQEKYVSGKLSQEQLIELKSIFSEELG